MLVNFIKHFFVIDLSDDLNKYKDEFNKLITQNNIGKCEKGGIALLLLNVILIIIDLFVYKSLRSETPAYIYLYYSHVIVSVLILFWYSILYINNKCNKPISERLLCYSFIVIALYWCVFMGLNDLNISGQISAYIICPLALSAGLYLRPREAFIMYFGSLIIFIIALCFMVSSNRILNSHIINASIAVLFSQVVSKLNYTSLVKDFLNKKTLLENKKELENSNRKLKEYEKLRTEFFSNISHEFRTPLNVICSAQQMLDITLSKEACYIGKTKKYIDIVKHNANRLIRLINNLIDITKIDASGFQVKLLNSDIVRVVEDITLSVADYVEHMGLTLTFDTEIEEHIIACDPEIIERIILNMLSNSIKFTDKGGNILVRVYLEKGSVIISVRDTGIGIPKDMQALIFDKFIQVDKSIKRKREGSGIGLSLVKSLVEMHGGNISVNSNLGEGSEFIVSLPDRQVTQEKDEISPHVIVNTYSDKINIEFSDIYD